MDLSDNTILKLFVPAVFFFTGVGLVMHGIRNRRTGLASIHWPTVTGRILSNGVEDNGDYWIPTARYEYAVAGKRYESNVIQVEFAAMWHEEAEEYAASLPVGGPVEVRYDPAAPENAVLRTIENPGRLSIVLGPLSSAVGLGSAYYFWFVG
jgi:hypothetical protein